MTPVFDPVAFAAAMNSLRLHPNQEEIQPPAPEPLPEDVQHPVGVNPAGGVPASTPLPEAPLEEVPEVEGIDGDPDGD